MKAKCFNLDKIVSVRVTAQFVPCAKNYLALPTQAPVKNKS